MIPLQGTADLYRRRRDGTEVFTTVAVLAAAEDGDLLVVPSWLANAAPRWVSQLGCTVSDFTPAANHVPAAPGWWARIKSDEDEDGATRLVPVVAWRMGDEPAPVILGGLDRTDCIEDVIEDPSHSSLVEGRVDAFIYDPDRRTPDAAP